MGHFIVEGISTWVKSPMKIHGRFYTGKIPHENSRSPFFVSKVKKAYRCSQLGKIEPIRLSE